MRVLVLLILLATPARAFDYYVLSLSWSPTWCAQGGEGDQCDAGRGFVLHGLWPQNEQGWPEWCHGGRDPARADSRAMEDLMPPGLAWYQWKKHGRCSGLSGRDYLDTMRQGFQAVTIPQVFRDLRRDVRLPASVVEDAFIEANPALGPDAITVTCDAGMIDEVRICLTKDLTPRDCAPDTRRDCSLGDAQMPGR